LVIFTGKLSRAGNLRFRATNEQGQVRSHHGEVE